MKILFMLLGLVVFACGLPAQTARVEISAITLTPGRVIAIEKKQGNIATFTVYNLTAQVAEDPAGLPVQDIGLQKLLAYTHATGAGP